MLLSIIVPFFNSVAKCERLLNTLGELSDPHIEFILIDDGSSDDTYNHIVQFEKKAKCKTIVLKQENRGPGGARNHGLMFAIGTYVWFVDSDDNICPKAIGFLKEKVSEQKCFDFIDFDVRSIKGVVNGLGILPGIYLDRTVVRLNLLNNFGFVNSKILRREILVVNHILYPENCYYEDCPLALSYPFHITSFIKSELIGYFYYEEFESITRVQKINPRHYDRMSVMYESARRAIVLAEDQKESTLIEIKFVQGYLLGLLGFIITKMPSINWLMAVRVIRNFREDAASLNLRTKVFPLVVASKSWKLVFFCLWCLSYIIFSQKKYFINMHKKAWGKDIKFFK